MKIHVLSLLLLAGFCSEASAGYEAWGLDFREAEKLRGALVRGDLYPVYEASPAGRLDLL